MVGRFFYALKIFFLTLLKYFLIKLKYYHIYLIFASTNSIRKSTKQKINYETTYRLPEL